MNVARLADWLGRRDARYLGKRVAALVRRYGVRSGKAKKRAIECVRLLEPYGLLPSFATPGRVVSKNPTFCRGLHEMGAELLVHGHDHVDFRSLSPDEATRQFAEAAAAFSRDGIPFDGFRCPYLSYTDELLAAIPPGMFEYSSNKAVWWDVVSRDGASARSVFEALEGFYGAGSADATVCMPRSSNGLVEIPVSLPDDLQLYDGLGFGEEGIRDAWMKILHQTHARGELFAPLFHPELFEECRLAFEALAREAARLRPRVWMAQLRDVARWWREKAAFSVDLSSEANRSVVRFRCTDRATVLVRNVETADESREWDGAYRVLPGRTLNLASDLLPFVGVARDVPRPVVALLAEQGYVLAHGQEAARCGLVLDGDTVAELGSELGAIELVERSPAPLARYWRWPEEAKSALCIAGDLDALSLRDYAGRLITL